MSLLQALQLPPRPTARGANVPGREPVALVIRTPQPFEPGARQALRATVMHGDGSTKDVSATVRWQSSDEAVVSVQPGGLARAGLGSGRATLSARTADGRLGATVEVTVVAALQDIVVTPANPLGRIGETEVLKATAVYADGHTEDVTARAQWTSSRPEVADFADPGSCVVYRAGTTVLAATLAEAKLSGTTHLSVPAAGREPALRSIDIQPRNPDIRGATTVRFQAYGVFADGSRHELTERVTWQSTRPKSLAIDRRGLARPGLESGQPRVVAIDPQTQVSGFTTVDVEMPGVRSLSVSPRQLELGVGERADVKVLAALHGGGTLEANPWVVWTPDDPAIARVSAAGTQVEGVAPGDTAIEVRDPDSGLSEVLVVSVGQAVLQQILVSAPGAPLRAGTTQALTATGLFSDGSHHDLPKPAWSSSRPELLEVDARGQVTAKAAGRVEVRARDRASGVEGSVELTVLPQ